MKKAMSWLIVASAWAALVPAPVTRGQGTPARERLLMDFGWRFTTEAQTDAQAPALDDKAWRTVDLPHDWSIEGKISKDHPMGGPGGFFPAGVGWYRLHFDAPQAWTGKRVTIEFEGVYMNCDVWLNGQALGSHPYGYTAFVYDLTPHLKPGSPNVLAVRVDNSRHLNSRWYSGSGIYRHVWLIVTEPVHVAQWGVFVTTPEVSVDKADVMIRTVVQNDSEQVQTCRVENQVLDPAGKAVGTEASQVDVPAKAETSVPQAVRVASPQLWSPDAPRLYRVVTRVLIGDKAVDEVRMPFGVRSIRVSAENGLQFNGKTVKLCGGCLHHDNGCLGAAAFDRAEQRRVELLKAAGFTALRTAHNPPSPAFLDACDQLGMLVIDESFDCWERGKNRFDYSQVFKEGWQRDMDAMVLRDRNHPCVVMWSIGNEVGERDTPDGVRIGKMLADYARRLDPTRPVTSAICWAQEGRPWSATDGLFAQLDVGGYNYTLDNDQADHRRVPARVMAATESFPSATFDYWRRVQDNPFIIGDFVWTALDYLGESGIGRWCYPGEPSSGHGENRLYPWHGAWCGDLDLTGWRKPISHYRNILWNRGERLYLAVREPQTEDRKITVTGWGVWPAWPTWTWPGWEGKDLQVEVYSSCDKVRLYLNDKLIGERPTSRKEEFKATFAVPYAPGTLKAAGVQDGKEVAESVLTTVGDAAQIRLTPDRATIKADGQDLSFVTVEVIDKAGRVQPNGDQLIQFSLTGSAEIAGVDNGDLKNEDPYQGHQRKAWHGRALAVVRSSRTAGTITLTARAQGLADGTVTIMSCPIGQ